MPESQLNPPLLKMIDLNATDVFLGMILAFILCAILGRVTKITTANAVSEHALPRTMMLMGAIVALIMAVIGNSLARAFGAIGALSLIRFRTAVKSTDDLAYLFMAISIGMTCGSGYFGIATGAAGIFALCIILIQKISGGQIATGVSMLRISYPAGDQLRSQIVDSFTQKSLHFRILSEENNNDGKTADMLVELTVPPQWASGTFLQEICELAEGVKASILLQ